MSNIHIRTIYSPDFAFVRCSFYKTNFSLSFYPWLSRDERGLSRYDMKNYLSTTISDENAAALYLLSRQIVEGCLSNPVRYVIPCNKQTQLIFEYGPDQNTQMRASLTIEKQKDQIRLEFSVNRYKTKENGQIVEKTLQSGLWVFAEVLQTYLTEVGANWQPNKQAETGSNVSTMIPEIPWL